MLKEAVLSIKFVEFSDDEEGKESDSASRRDETIVETEHEERDENALSEGDNDQDVDDAEEVEE